MGLDVPDLDDRTYEEFREDARKRIPVHAPEWTDHNVHDPGITILELLAWLAESHTYQLDRVGDRHLRKYLDLVDVRPRPPEAATVALSLDVPRPEDPSSPSDPADPASTPDPADLDDPGDLDDLDGEAVAPGTEVGAETPAGRKEWFLTTEGVELSTAGVAAVVSEHDGGRTEHTRANESEEMHFHAFGPDPEAGDALYLGFDANPFASPVLDLRIDYHDADLPAPASHGDEAVDFEPSLRVVWEHPTKPAEWYRDEAWEPVPVERDETNHLYSGGRVRLTRPSGWIDDVATVAEHDEALYWVRCRLTAVEPKPPPAGLCDPPDPKPAPEPWYEVPPRIDAVDVNVLRARHRRPITDERLATPDGRDETSAAPNQRFDLGHAPVLTAPDDAAATGSDPGSALGSGEPPPWGPPDPPEITVEVGGEAWTQREDFDESGPDDSHYVLDRAAGTITFGDGRRGKIPEPHLPVEADYDAGGGPDGNVPAGADWAFPATSLGRMGVTPLAPPSGGTGAESIQSALARAREQRREPFRTVTDEDYRYVATHTPGLRFGRAALARPAAKPEARGADEGESDGADDVEPDGADATHPEPRPARVVVAPHSPDGRLPIPSRGFREAVERHLCRHALLTERVEVVGPTFVGIDVSAEVDPVEGADPAAVREAVRERLADFLDPLTGFDGEGWPFGRPVYHSELYEQIETMDRVADAVDVGVATPGDASMGDGDDTLPDLRAVDVSIHDEGERCGRGA